MNRLFILVLCLWTLCTFGQAPDGKVNIRVLDEQGHPVSGAKVFVTASSRIQQELLRTDLSEAEREFFAVVFRVGVESKTNADGATVAERTEASMMATAILDSRLAHVQVPEDATEPVVLRLQEDQDVVIQVVDENGKPQPKVPVVMFQRFGGMEEFTPAIWTSETVGSSGLATLRHAQFWCDAQAGPEAHYQLALAIPMREKRSVEIDPRALPDEPVVLTLPKYGGVLVKMAEAPGSWARLRKLPPATGEGLVRGERTPWMFETNARVNFEKGIARFPYVEVGLEIQVEAQWKDAVAPASVVRPGPTKPGEEVVIEIGAEQGPGGLVLSEEDVVILDGQKVLQPRTLFLTSNSFDNDSFTLCFVPADNPEERNRDLDLRIGSWSPPRRGWHSVPSEVPEQRLGHFQFAGLDAKRAESISRQLKVPIARIAKRPYELKATFELNEDTYPPKGTVQLAMVVENVGDTPVSLDRGGWQRGANRHARFAFQITKDGAQLPDIGVTQSFGGLSSSQTVQAGKKFEEQVELSQWCAFDTRGVYEVDVSFELHVTETPLPMEGGDACPIFKEECTDQLRGHLQVHVR